MPLTSIEATAENSSQKSLLQRLSIPFVLLFLVAHALIGVCFVNQHLLLVPDSAEFLIGARALSTGQGYRDLSDPAMPLLTRPVGMSLLLAPVAGVHGYDAAACKWLILAVSTLGCLFSYFIIRRVACTGAALLVLGMLSLSPVTITYAGQVFSEVPYATYIVAITFLLMGAVNEPEKFAWWRLIAVGCLTIAAEKTRSQGLLLWPALIVWGVFHPSRRRILAAIGGAIAISISITMLFDLGGSVTDRYLPFLRELRGESGAASLLSSAMASLRYYLLSLSAVYLPFAWPDLFYFGIQIPIWAPLAVVIGSACVVAALVGMYGRYRESRTNGEVLFALTNVIGTLALLLIWPHQMSRLCYPLFGLLTVYSWYGVFRAARRWSMYGACLMALVHFASMAWLIGVGSPPNGDLAIWRRDGDWLRENTPPYTRVLTTRKELFFTSQRFQVSIFPRGMPLGALNEVVHDSGIRYARLDVRTAGPLLTRNPELVFRSVVKNAGFTTLWEIQPNWKGTVPREPSDALLEPSERLSQSGAEVGDRPFAAGEQQLRQRIARLPPHSIEATNLWFELGHLLLRSMRPEEARDCFERVRGGINADLYETSVQASLRAIQAMIRAADPSVPVAERVRMLMALALRNADFGNWNDSLELVNRVIELDAGHIESRLFRVFIYRRFGDWDAAMCELEEVNRLIAARIPDESIRRQNTLGKEYSRHHALIQFPRILEEGEPTDLLINGVVVTVDPRQVELYLITADMLRQDGLLGAALRILRLGTDRFPESPVLWAAVGNAWRAFGRFDLALESLERARRLAPQDSSIAESIARVQAVLESSPVH